MGKNYRYLTVALLIAVGAASLLFFRVSQNRTGYAVNVIENRPLQSLDGRASGVAYKEPRGLTFTQAGSLLIADFRNYRIQEVSVAGQILREWGSAGNGPGQFTDPTSAVMDAQGNLYVADTWNHRIQKCAPDGQWTANWAQFAGFSAPRGIALDAQNRVYVANTSGHNVVVFDAQGRHLATWGRQGNGLPDFYSPVGIAVGPDGNIYVADTGNKRIKVLAPDGRPLFVIPVAEWGFAQFHEAYLAVGPHLEIYATLPQQHVIRVYHPPSQTAFEFGNAAQLNFPTGIAVDPAGNIYVSDTAHNRVVKYAPLPANLFSKTAKQGSNMPMIAILSTLLLLSVLLNVCLLLQKRGFGRFAGGARKLRRPSALRAAHLLNPLRDHAWLQHSLYVAAALCLAGALVLFARHQPQGGAIWLLAGLLLCFLHAFAETAETPRLRGREFGRPAAWLPPAWFWISLGLLTLCAFALRSYRIESFPWGINNDVAWEGIFARRFLVGKAPLTVFTSETWGKETLYFYLIALSFKLFGVSTLTLALPSILAGTAACAAIFLLWRKLFDERLALLGAVIYTAMAWNLVFARMSARCILAPLCLALTGWLYFRAVDATSQRDKWLAFFGGGFALGVGLHTYFSFRGIPVLMVLVGLQSWLTTPRFLRKNWGGLLAYIFAATLAFAPLGIYAYQHLEIFMGRSNFLFVGHRMAEAGSWQPLWDNIAANLLTLYDQAKVGNFVKNDIPIISPLLGFFAAIGLAYHLRHFFARGSFFAVLAFGFGMLPAMLSAPDAARSHLTTVALSIFAATGVQSLARFCTAWKLKKAAHVLAAVFCAGIVLAEGYLYFGVWGNDFGAQYGYARKHTLIGYKGLELAQDHQIYIAQGHFMDTPQFICYGLPGDVFGITQGEVIHYVPAPQLLNNVRRVLQTPVPPGKGLAFVFEQTPENIAVFEAVRQRYPQGIRQDYRDYRYRDAVIFYTYVIPRINL